MTAIMTRSALVFWGHNPPPNVHSVVVEFGERRVITWDDVMRARREKQRLRLEQIRRVEPWRAVKLSVAYFGNGLMGGWHAFIDGIVQGWNSEHVWIDRDAKGLIPVLMELFPLAKSDLFSSASWQDWKVAFAKRFKRRRQCGRPVGVVYLWKRGRELRLVERVVSARQ